MHPLQPGQAAASLGCKIITCFPQAAHARQVYVFGNIYLCGVQSLEQRGELVEQHADPLTHPLARRQHGVTQAALQAAVTAGKIPLLLTNVEGARAAKARGLDCLCVFLAPASPEVCPALDTITGSPLTRIIMLFACVLYCAIVRAKFE